MTTPRSTFVVPASKPRNPLVPAARQRRAGAHGPTGGARRRQGRDALRRELHALPAGDRGRPPSP